MNTKAKRLTDAICRDLPRLDKRYFKPGDYPGLQFWVAPGGTKTWYYQYKIKDKKIFLNKNTIILNSSGKKRIFITIIDENNITSGIKWLSIKQINVLIPAAEL